LACAVGLGCAGCGNPPTRGEAIERYGTELREAVSSNIDDPGRRAQTLQVVDRIKALHVRFSKETADYIDAFRRLNTDYDATRPAFDELFAHYEAQRTKARNEALDLHYELAARATEGEWKAIGKAEAKLYEETNGARPVREGVE
jgi:hypothetical protein